MSTVEIIGTGLVSCLGGNRRETWQNMLDGKCGVRPLSRFPAADFPQPAGGQLAAGIEAGLREKYGDSDLALCLIREAAAEALGDFEPDDDTGLVLATNFGLMGTREWCWRERLDVGELDSDTFRLQQDVVRRVAKLLGIGRPRAQLSLSCASGAGAVALAWEWLQAGRCKRVLAIGYDTLTEFCWCGLSNLRTITTDKLRPFDVNRQGTIFSEGAAAILLSVREDDRARSLGRVLGAATNNNAYHLTAPAKGAEGSRRVMVAALKAAGVTVEAIDFISAHATGTTANDQTECAAFNALLGGRKVPVAAFKSNFGHMLGAAGLAEIVIAVEALREGLLPPVINLEEQDPECDVDCVRDEPRQGSFNIALTNSAGLGGSNAATVIAATHSHTPTLPHSHPLYLRGFGWVLPGELGGGPALPALAPDRLIAANAELEGFSIKPYIHSVKGYLDPAGAYSLAAASLCLEGQGPRDLARTAVISVTQYGAPRSGYKFFAQMIAKGHHFASPMIFPHSYSNTAGNLAAIEFGFSGPHFVFDAATDGAEAWRLAGDLLRRGLADDALVILYEATDEQVLPDGFEVLNGALCAWFSLTPAKTPAELPSLDPHPDNRRGVLHPTLLDFLK